MSTSHQQAVALIKRHNADMNEFGNGRTDLRGDVWTPPGTTWVATGGHCLAFNFFTNRRAGWKALLDDLRYGVQPCTLEDCEICEG